MNRRKKSIIKTESIELFDEFVGLQLAEVRHHTARVCQRDCI